MRILYLSQYFPPEAGATQTRAYEIARNFVRLGHQVTMIAEVPNHPSGVIWTGFRGKLLSRDRLDGIDVIRVWVKASPVKNFKNRMFFYLSYMVNAILAGIVATRGQHDLLYASSPPLFVGGAALALSALKHIPLVFEVRDLWPESAVALGEITNQHFIAWASRLEMACYRRARKVIVVTEGIYQHLVERGVSPDKIVLSPNGANTELFTFRPQSRSRLRAELRLENKFVVIYAGIHGIAQGLETLVEAARLLQSGGETQDPDIIILMIGDGPKKEEISRLAEAYNLPNVILLPEKLRQEIPDYLSSADVALIPLRKLELFKSALPSKLFDAWACELPVLLSVDGEARCIMEKAGGGRFIPPEDPQALAQALIQMKNDPLERQEMGRRGRQFTIKHYSRQALAEQLISTLEESL